MLGCGKAGAAAALDVLGKFAHRFAGDDAAFATSERGFGFIHGSQDFRAGAFALFPKAQGFLHGVFGMVQAPALDSLADEGLLIGSELDFH